MKAGALLLLVAGVPFLFAGCGSGNSTPPPPPPPSQFNIGGTASNLAVKNGGLQLQNNGADTLSVGVDGSFMFSTPVTSGGAYSVTVSQQPSNPTQMCEVVNGTGTATANVTNVTVDCGHGEWTWMGGSQAANQAGTYGTLGTPAATNIPGGRTAAAHWTDASGNFWLFGGNGYDSGGATDNLNDLWKYSNGEWTWVGGSDLIDQHGMYGTLGTPATTSVPGARYGPMAWSDSSGNIWLFGGFGSDSAGTVGDLNDLWKYGGGQWTWMAGSNVVNQNGIYGTKGTPAATNIPGARDRGVSWVDASGNVFLFGGEGLGSPGLQGALSDLWEFSNGEWTWIGGDGQGNLSAVYGTQGRPSPSNTPGSRVGAVTWTDSSGDVWLFGGDGYDSAGTSGELNDLWKYSGGQWTWMAGSNVVNQKGTYGTQGTPSAANAPGARFIARTWTDSSGNVWLFGGTGYDSAGTLGDLNDLWKYSNGQWTWMSGSDLANQAGTFGTVGTPLPGNVPSGRRFPAVWIDTQGNLWLFGGQSNDSGATSVQLNDLWKYEP